MPNYVSNIYKGTTSYPIGGKNFDSKPVMFTSDQPNLLVDAAATEHNLLFMATTLVSNGVSTYSLANILPSDNYNYDLCLSVWSRPPEKSGNNISLGVLGGTHSTRGELFQTVAVRRARTNATYRSFETIWVPIPNNDKAVTFFNWGNSTATYNCMLHGYRRLGTNA